MVLPVSSAPPATAQKLAAEMAAALIDRNVPAFLTRGNRSSMSLYGKVIDPGQNAMIAWTLVDFSGAEIGRYEQVIEGTPVDLWAAADPDLMAELADEAAPAIAIFIQGEDVAETKAPPVFVGNVRGTTAQNAVRLQVSLRQSLRQLGAQIANVPSQQTLVASADVAIAALSEERSEVAIAWVIKDPFGTQIGKIEQASPLERQVVEQDWASVARQAGVAAAAGIVELISQIDWSQGFIPPAPAAAPQSP